MIIVEGPDGGGKTTLIQGLKYRYWLEVAPRVVSKEATALTDLKKWVDDNLEKGLQWLIFDRHRLISETIYGPTLREYAEPGFTDLTWMYLNMKAFYEMKPVIIYCLPPYEVVRANVENDPDNTAVAWKIESIYQAYVARAVQDQLLMPSQVMVYDYTSDGKEEDPLLMFDNRIANLRKRVADTWS